MRPRPDAAENQTEPLQQTRAALQASMRPRPDAAENLVLDTPSAVAGGRFNEAAARCRGKLVNRQAARPDAHRLQ